MTVHELAEVATVDFTVSDRPVYSDRRRHMDSSKVASICYGLVNEIDDVVKLARFSEPPSHSTIGKIGLAYHFHFINSESFLKDTLASVSLARYALLLFNLPPFICHLHMSS